MTFAWSFAVNLFIYYIATVVARYTKGRIGSGIFAIILMLAGFWSGLLPKDLAQIGHFPLLYQMVMLVFVVHLGTSFNWEQLKREWRLALVTLSGILGIAVFALGVGSRLFGKNIAMISYPSLVGGSVATLIMRDAAVEQGWLDLAGIVAILSSMQVWIGIPMISYGTRKECRYVLSLFREHGAGVDVDGRISVEEATASMHAQAAAAKTDLYDRLPVQWKDQILPLLAVTLFGAVAKSITPYVESWTHNLITFSVIALVFGILGRRLGLLPKEPLQKAGVFPFFMFCMLTSLRGNLANLTPTDILNNLVPLISFLLLGALGILIFCIPIGRVFGFRIGMMIAFSFGMYAGYPLNYQAALEVIELEAKTPEELDFLKEKVLTRVVLGSVLGQVIASIAIAGVFVGLLRS